MFTVDFVYLGAGLVLGWLACHKGVFIGRKQSPLSLLDAIRKELEPYRQQQEMLQLLKEFLEKQGGKA